MADPVVVAMRAPELLALVTRSVGREGPWPPLLGDGTGSPLVGRPTKDGFRIRRRQRIFSGWAPYLYARVESAGENSLVRAHIGVHPVVAVGLIIQLSAAAVIAAGSLIAGLFARTAGSHVFIGLSVIPLVLAGGIVLGARRVRARDAAILRAFLASLLPSRPVESNPEHGHIGGPT